MQYVTRYGRFLLVGYKQFAIFISSRDRVGVKICFSEVIYMARCEFFMGKDNSGWENIASIEGLEVEWDFEPENVLGKRDHERIPAASILSFIGIKDLKIHVSTVHKNFSGTLLDIGVGGMAIDSSVQLEQNQLLKLGFILGRKKVISKAQVRWVKKIQESFKMGVMFVHLSADDANFIAGIYGAQKVTGY